MPRAARIGNARRILGAASGPTLFDMGRLNMNRRFITIAALVERDRRNRKLARVAATVAGAGLTLAILALPIGWALTW